jgi:hypothetical protein
LHGSLSKDRPLFRRRVSVLAYKSGRLLGKRPQRLNSVFSVRPSQACHDCSSNKGAYSVSARLPHSGALRGIPPIISIGTQFPQGYSANGAASATTMLAGWLAYLIACLLLLLAAACYGVLLATTCCCSANPLVSCGSGNWHPFPRGTWVCGCFSPPILESLDSGTLPPSACSSSSMQIGSEPRVSTTRMKPEGSKRTFDILLLQEQDLNLASHVDNLRLQTTPTCNFPTLRTGIVQVFAHAHWLLVLYDAPSVRAFYTFPSFLLSFQWPRRSSLTNMTRSGLRTHDTGTSAFYKMPTHLLFRPNPTSAVISQRLK